MEEQKIIFLLASLGALTRSQRFQAVQELRTEEPVAAALVAGAERWDESEDEPEEGLPVTVTRLRELLARRCGPTAEFETVAGFAAALSRAADIAGLGVRGEAGRPARVDFTSLAPLGELLLPHVRMARGVHFTPRPLVERIVEATVLEPLRRDWQAALAASDEGAFHRRLLNLRVLDPACGAGNILAVAFQGVKELEFEVLGKLGAGKPQRRVGPDQFIGIEVDAWSAALAELILWCGALHWHPRRDDPIERVAEPALETRDGIVGEEGGPASWPSADFIVGNPPFLGGRKMLGVLGEEVVGRLRQAYGDVPRSADLAMVWWARGAQALSRPDAAGRPVRCGLVMPNSYYAPSNRQVVARALAGGRPLRLVCEQPDLVWREGSGSNSGRVVVTVLERVAAVETRATVDVQDDRRRVVMGLRVDARPKIEDSRPKCGQGVKLVGDFSATTHDREIVNPVTGAPVIRPLIRSRRLLEGREPDRVIDFTGLSMREAARLHPKAFADLRRRVEPERRTNRRREIRERWWRFGWERQALRRALEGLSRYIVTAAVAKHRLFVFVPSDWLPDGSLYAIASDEAWTLGVLSSRAHRLWAHAAGGRLRDAVTWTSRRSYSSFPFPPAAVEGRLVVGELAERIDVLRRGILATESLTWSGLYDAILQQGAGLSPAMRALRQLHGELDRVVLSLYGVAPDSEDHAVVERMLALTATG